MKQLLLVFVAGLLLCGNLYASGGDGAGGPHGQQGTRNKSLNPEFPSMGVGGGGPSGRGQGGNGRSLIISGGDGSGPRGAKQV